MKPTEKTRLSPTGIVPPKSGRNLVNVIGVVLLLSLAFAALIVFWGTLTSPSSKGGSTELNERESIIEGRTEQDRGDFNERIAGIPWENLPADLVKPIWNPATEAICQCSMDCPFKEKKRQCLFASKNFDPSDCEMECCRDPECYGYQFGANGKCQMGWEANCNTYNFDPVNGKVKTCFNMAPFQFDDYWNARYKNAGASFNKGLLTRCPADDTPGQWYYNGQPTCVGAGLYDEECLDDMRCREEGHGAGQTQMQWIDEVVSLGGCAPLICDELFPDATICGSTTQDCTVYAKTDRKSCGDYCASKGKRCLKGWDDWYGTCTTVTEVGCDKDLKDQICRCTSG